MRCSANTAIINLMVFLIRVLQRSGAEIWNFRCLSGYELAGNEIFLRHGTGTGAVEVQHR